MCKNQFKSQNPAFLLAGNIKLDWFLCPNMNYKVGSKYLQSKFNQSWLWSNKESYLEHHVKAKKSITHNITCI